MGDVDVDVHGGGEQLDRGNGQQAHVGCTMPHGGLRLLVLNMNAQL
jgi:hypothetical protein